MSDVTRRRVLGAVAGAAGLGGLRAGTANSGGEAGQAVSGPVDEGVGSGRASVHGDAGRRRHAAPGAAGRCNPVIESVRVTPEDPRYADLILRKANARFQGRPEYVHLVGSTEHVVDAVQQAVREHKRIAVRSGGHCFEDFVDHPDVQVVIDLSQLTEIGYDPRMNAFLIGPGNTLWDVFERLYLGWGVTIPGGNCGDVGIGGHLCGGGYGPLSRQFGSVVDYLYAVEVVVVDRRGRARAVVATREPDDPHRDLWWAHTGGGGGNFGVVTKYWLRAPDAEGRDPSRLLPRPPASLLSRVVLFPWERMSKNSLTRLIRNHGEWFERNSAPGSPYTALWSVLMLNARTGTLPDTEAHLLFTTMDATVPNARAMLDDYVAAIADGVEPSPQDLGTTEQPWLTAARELNAGQRGETGPVKLKAGYLRRRFTDDQIDTLHAYLSAPEDGIEFGSVWLVAYGGQVNAVEPSATAMPQRDSILKAIYLAGWSGPDAEPKHLDWVRRFYRDVYAETGGVPVPGEVSDGSYINYPDGDLADPTWNTSGVPWFALYYKDNYARLQQVKAAYDPRNVFRHRLSVRLPE